MWGIALTVPVVTAIACWHRLTSSFSANRYPSHESLLSRSSSHRSSLFLLGLSLALGSSTAAAAERSDPWSQNGLTAVSPQLAMLPSLPPPPLPRLFAITPERRALLNTIRYAEGTWRQGQPEGYRVLFGGSVVDSLDRHPNRVMFSARYASAAAGAYQFMPSTWNLIVRELGFRDFQPDSQDQGALLLIQRRGALPLADRGVLTPELTARLAPEWASFPTLAGVSYYGQPVRRYEELRRFYNENLAQLRQDNSRVWENVAIQQVAPRCQGKQELCALEAAAPSSSAATTVPDVVLINPN